MPKLLTTPFAIDSQLRTDIQESQGAESNSATYRLGFPEETMRKIALGGKPPKGEDMNGILYDLSDNIVYQTQGGRYKFDLNYATKIGGYPQNAILQLDDGSEVLSTIPSNTANPNTDMTGWELTGGARTDAQLMTWSGRTQEEKNKDIISVRDYIKTPIDGSTSNQDGLVAAVADAKLKGFDLYYPAGIYVSDDNIPNFNDVRHFGSGIIKRGSISFSISPNGGTTEINRFYVSTTGDDANDGLSLDKPLKTIQKALDCISSFGISLSGGWRVELAEGTYTAGGVISEVRSNQYISIHCSASTDTEPKAIIDMTGTGKAFGLSFSQNMRVWCKGIKVKGTRNGSNLEAGFLADSKTTLYLDHCFSEDSAGNGVKANIGCRLLVAGGSYKSDGTAVLVYNSTAFVGYNAKRVRVSGSAGVSVEGSSCAHVDYIDYKDCAFGLISENESHSTNYDSTFENVSVGWECRGFSTINSARYTFVNPPSITKGRSLIPFGCGIDDQASPSTVGNRSLMFYPYLGTQGRWAFGYNQINPPHRCYQYSVDGSLSGTNLSLAAGVGMAVDSSSVNYIGVYAPSNLFSGIAFGDEQNANSAHIRHQGGNIYFNSNNAARYRFTSTSFGSFVDNTIDLGTSSLRIKNTYLANAPIVTSDERLKQQFRSQTEREKEAALEIKSSICLFKFSDAVDLKGDGARWHCGVKAQQVIEIMRRHDLEPFDYGFICFDEWEAEFEPVLEEQEHIGEDGNASKVLVDTGEVRKILEAGNRYAIRYDELAMFILMAI